MGLLQPLFVENKKRRRGKVGVTGRTNCGRIWILRPVLESPEPGEYGGVVGLWIAPPGHPPDQRHPPIYL